MTGMNSSIAPRREGPFIWVSVIVMLAFVLLDGAACLRAQDLLRDCMAMATRAPMRVAGKSWPTMASAMVR
jgi:hypothetical protein